MLRVAALAFCGLVVLHGQQPTFKSTTALVEVDAIFLDRNGNFVPGLKAENVTILENGKPQKIQQFFMVTKDLGLRAGSVASEFADQAQFGSHRVFVLLFDEAHLANESLMRVKAGAERGGAAPNAAVSRAMVASLWSIYDAGCILALKP